MDKETWIYNGTQFEQASKWDLFKYKIKRFFTKYKIINTRKNTIISIEDLKLYFKISEKEYNESKKIYNEKGNISYEFIPNGIGYILKIHVLNTNEIIDITDYESL